MDVQSATGTKDTLTYEETPVIEPVIPAAAAEYPPSALPPQPEEQSVPPSPKSQHGGIMGTIGTVMLFMLLFLAGVGISVYLRQYLGSREEVPLAQDPAVTAAPTLQPTPVAADFFSPPATPTATLRPISTAWKSQPVLSGTTKKAIPGLIFELPPDVAAPVCDGGNCASQGTYLPGGSRFTVAPRGRGQLLVDARGQVGLTDASGKAFVVKPVTITNGKKALEYTGEFQGSTVGGYTFTRMHGFMIEIDDGITLEMNHFAPSGITVAYGEDEVIFAKVVNSVSVEKNPATAPSSALAPLNTTTSTPAASFSPTP